MVVIACTWYTNDSWKAQFTLEPHPYPCVILNHYINNHSWKTWILWSQIVQKTLSSFFLYCNTNNESITWNSISFNILANLFQRMFVRIKLRSISLPVVIDGHCVNNHSQRHWTSTLSAHGSFTNGAWIAMRSKRISSRHLLFCIII